MADDNDRDPSLFEVLLITKILVSCQEQIITSLLSSGQKFAISETGPSEIGCNPNYMSRQIAADRNRRSLIKENPHHGPNDGALSKLRAANAITS